MTTAPPVRPLRRRARRAAALGRDQPLARPGHRLPRAVHGDPRRDGGERRAADRSSATSASPRPTCSGSINAYTLIFGGFLLLGGRAGDLFGRRQAVPAGVVLFSSASLLYGLATSETWLVVARGLQGLGGALVSPAALSIITTTFAEGEDRTKALGVWSAIAAGGGAFGLLLGGMLTDLAELGVGLLRQRPDRHRHGAARAPLRAGVAAPCAGVGRARPAGRGHRHRRPDRARLRDRQGGVQRLGLGDDARASPRSPSRCSPRSSSSSAARPRR